MSYTLKETEDVNLITSSPGVADTLPNSNSSGIANVDHALNKSIIGNCPRCKAAVMEKFRGYFCCNPNCKFALFKDAGLFTSQKRTFDRSIAIALVTNGSVFVTGFISQKTQMPYNALVRLDSEGDGWPQFRLEFVK